jgi:hypothetical protein
MLLVSYPRAIAKLNESGPRIQKELSEASYVTSSTPVVAGRGKLLEGATRQPGK